MRQWRVGSLSMGMILITLGVILLASILKGYPIVDQLLTWWPVVLVLLGLEVLGYLYFSKQEQPKIKYDLFSMLIITVIGFLSIGLYTLSTIGLIPRVASFISSSSYAVVLPENIIDVPDHINNIVIEAPDMPLEIKGSGSASKMALLGKGEFFAPSREEAEKLVVGSGIRATAIENTLYVFFEEVPRRGDLSPGVRSLTYTLIMPEGKRVELKRNYGSQISLDGDAVSGSWIIDGVGRVKVNGNERNNLKIIADMSHPQGLRVNVEWATVEKQEGSHAEGMVTFGEGEGKHSLNIIRSNEVEVYNLGKN